MMAMTARVLSAVGLVLLNLQAASAVQADGPELSNLKVACARNPLAGLQVALAPPFNPKTRAYATSVAMSVANISVLPTTTCTGCKIFVCINTSKIAVTGGVASPNISIPLKHDTNITIMVEAPSAHDASAPPPVTNYSLNITKVADPPPPPPSPPPPAPPPPPPSPPYDPSTDATLRGLSSNPGQLDPEFSPHVFEYQLLTGSSALPPSVLLRAAPNSSSATMELNGEVLHDASWSEPVALAGDSAAVVVVTNGDSQHAYTIHLHRPLPPPGPERDVRQVEDWLEGASQPGWLVAIAGLGGFAAVGCLGLVMRGRGGGGRSSSDRGGGGEDEGYRPEDSPPPDSWRQAPFYSPGVGAFMDDDGDDAVGGDGVAEAQPPPLRLDAADDDGAAGRGSGYEYDRRYDPRPGDAAKDEQARQWDSRYDGLEIGTSVGGIDQ
jgi:hypothetical protein